MKKKVENPEAVLVRAEEFAGRGNYQAALKDFEKAFKVLERQDIQDRIKTCRTELGRLRRKELIKRGKHHVGKKNHSKALQCFEEAYALAGDDWLEERINGLKELLNHRDAFQAATKAEAAGQFDKAADLYGQVSGGRIEEEIIIRRACCLVRAGREQDAGGALKDLPSIAHEPERWPAEIIADQGLVYDYGFTMARIGSYYECLKAWDFIKSDDSVFLEERERVRNRLQANLYERVDNSDSRNDSAGWAAILEEGRYLKETTGWDGCEDLISFCRLMQIERLWKKDEHESIEKLLLPYPEQMSSPLLALYAKAFFKLADLDEQYLPGLQLFWLSAMYDHEISSKFSPIPAERNELRQTLIQEAEGLVNKYVAAGSLPAKRILACWEAEKKLVEDLHALILSCPELSGPVCTPTFARTFGQAEPTLELIKESRDSFSDEESYLHAGSYFSSAGNSLLFLAGGECDNAMEALPRPQDRGSSEYREFEDYGIGRIRFAYGIHSLETGKKNPESYFKTLSSFFQQHSKYEHELINRAAHSHDMDELDSYEKILRNMYAKRRTAPIAEVLSLVIYRRAISMYNDDQINTRVLHRSMINALDLDPENEGARSVLDDTGCAGELEELHEAFDSNKMSRAARIADSSDHPEVREAFFTMMNGILYEIDEATGDKDRTLFMLNEVYKLCVRVDESHSLSNDVYGRIEMLEQSK